MTPEQIDRVFGRARLKMVTGEHVEVFREAAAAGERRRYTKRFLNTEEADFGQWTEREWRILARLIGHGIDCVPEVVQFDRGRAGGTQLVQTYDAGATVDQWATILPVARNGRVLRHVFEDCAHWWALAHHSLRALYAIHELSVVHLDIKGDNVCVPVGPHDFDPAGNTLAIFPRFAELALIDFAFALVSRESLTTALPIGWQTEYDYQSPRLLAALESGRRGDLKPTRELDWRCDMYSLAAMLKRYLPEEDAVLDASGVTGWSRKRAADARELILALRDAHDREATRERPHEALMRMTAAHIEEEDLAASLRAGFTLARDASVTPVAPSPLTPLTRLAPSIRVMLSPRAVAPVVPPIVMRRRTQAQASAVKPPRRARSMLLNVLLGVVAAIGVAAMAAPWLADRWPALGDRMRAFAQRDTPEPAPPPREEVAEAPKPKVEEVKPPPAPVEEAKTAPRAPVVVARPVSKPAAQVATAKPPPPAAKTPPPRVVATQTPPPARVRFYEPPPTRVATVTETPKEPEAAPAPPPVQAAVATPPAEAKPQPTPRSAAPQQQPATTLDSRSILSFFMNFAKRADKPAPIEDRAAMSREAPSPRVTAPPPPSPPVQTYEPPAISPSPVTEPPPREPAPRSAPPESASPQPLDLAARARRTIAESLPDAAARAEVEVSRIFAVAANAGHPANDRSVMEAVSRTWPGSYLQTGSGAPGMARQLSDDARQAFMAQRDVATAFDLQLRAFGANPRDPEVTGNLAYLYLRVNPPNAETARRLALVAIAQSPAPLRPSRADDWTTLGIASALTGRDSEAANALYVAIALTRNLDRTCRGVFRAVEEHGSRVAPAAQSMLARLRQQGRDYESSYCAWPARVNTARGGY